MEKDRTKEILDNLLHPVRMRVVMALTGSEGMTPLQIAEQLSDVPQATLYRHINRLAKAGILRVADEHPVRGTVEKVYAINQMSHAYLGGEELAHLTKEEHMHYFTAFTVSLMDQFSRYLEGRSKVDLAADGVGYSQTILFMNDEELIDFSRAINQVLLPYLRPPKGQEGGQKRTKRMLATIMMPDASGK